MNSVAPIPNVVCGINSSQSKHGRFSETGHKNGLDLDDLIFDPISHYHETVRLKNRPDSGIKNKTAHA